MKAQKCVTIIFTRDILFEHLTQIIIVVVVFMCDDDDEGDDDDDFDHTKRNTITGWQDTIGENDRRNIG